MMDGWAKLDQAVVPANPTVLRGVVESSRADEPFVHFGIAVVVFAVADLGNHSFRAARSEREQAPRISASLTAGTRSCGARALHSDRILVAHAGAGRWGALQATRHGGALVAGGARGAIETLRGAIPAASLLFPQVDATAGRDKAVVVLGARLAKVVRKGYADLSPVEREVAGFTVCCNTGGAVLHYFAFGVDCTGNKLLAIMVARSTMLGVQIETARKEVFVGSSVTIVVSAVADFGQSQLCGADPCAPLASPLAGTRRRSAARLVARGSRCEVQRVIERVHCPVTVVVEPVA